MTRPIAIRWSSTAVQRFVAAHPEGADCAVIAAHVGVSRQAVDQTLRSALRWARVAAVLDAWRDALRPEREA